MPEAIKSVSETEVPINSQNPAAVSAVVRRGNKYLLVLRANPPAQDMYAFPGGRVDPGEAAADAALRELKEETGIAGISARTYATYDLNASGVAGKTAYHLTVFIVDEPGDVIPLPLDDAAALGWFTIDEAGALSMPPSMHHCFSKLANTFANG